MIFGFLLLETRMFYIPRWPNFIASIGTPVFCGFFSLLCFLFFTILDNKISVKNFGKYIIFIILYMFIESFVAMLQFDNSSLISSFSWVLQYCTFLFYLVFFRIMKKDDFYYNWFKKMVIIFGSLYALFMIMECFIFNNFHTHILNIYGTTYGPDALVVTRIGSHNMRLYEGTSSSVILAGILSFDKLVSSAKGKRELFSLCVVALSFINIYYVSQSRILLLILVASFVAIFLNSINHRINKRTFVMLILGSIIIVLSMNYVLDVIDSLVFDLNSNSSLTFSIRIAELQYYYDLWKTNPIFGVGLIAGDSCKYIMHGPYLNFGYDDIGIVGVLFKYGIIGFAWYVLSGLYILKLYLKTKSNIILGLLVLFLGCCATLSYLDLGRTILFTLTMIIIDSERREIYAG